MRRWALVLVGAATLVVGVAVVVLAPSERDPAGNSGAGWFHTSSQAIDCRALLSGPSQIRVGRPFLVRFEADVTGDIALSNLVLGLRGPDALLATGRNGLERDRTFAQLEGGRVESMQAEFLATRAGQYVLHGWCREANGWAASSSHLTLVAGETAADDVINGQTHDLRVSTSFLGPVFPGQRFHAEIEVVNTGERPIAGLVVAGNAEGATALTPPKASPAALRSGDMRRFVLDFMAPNGRRDLIQIRASARDGRSWAAAGVVVTLTWRER